MITNRIKALEIEKRGLYTLVYGNTSDIFIGDDLKQYNFDQQIYLYLKSKGFSTVILYDQRNSFYSFQYDELHTFVSLETKFHSKQTKITTPLYKSGLGPLGGKNKIVQPLEVGSDTPTPPTVEKVNDKDGVYWKSIRPDIARCYKYFLDNSDLNIALVVMSPNVANLGSPETMDPLAQESLRRRSNKNKLIVVSDKSGRDDLIQDYQNSRGIESTFFSSFFFGRFIKTNRDSNLELTSNCILINHPDEKEVKNLLHYKRLMQNTNINLVTLNGLVEQIEKVKATGLMILDWDDEEIQKLQKQSKVGMDAWQELNSLIGLKGVKDTIKELVAGVEYDKELLKRGLVKKDSLFEMHYAFTGNPGTGKTTVAELFGKILKEIGVLKSGHLAKARRDDLVAGYSGQTAIKTRAKIDEAINGVLFIDEAYSLTNKGEQDSFGKEAIETLLEAMTDSKYKGNMAIIVAGYPDEMNQFINSNPGFPRRFTKFIHFEDYSSDDLVMIFENYLHAYSHQLGAKVKDKALAFFENIPRSKTFGNAGEATKLAEKAMSSLKLRLKNIGFQHPTDAELTTILAEDIPEPLYNAASDSTNPTSADSLADEILPKYQANNKTHVYIRQVCDEIQDVLIQIFLAYSGEDTYENPLRILENEAFKKRVESISNYSTEINFSLYEDIKTGMEAFRLFFRGIHSINQNEIENAVDYFKNSLPLAKASGIDELEQTEKFLIKYWGAILSLQDGDLKDMERKLKDIQNDIELSGTSEHYKQLSDLMQADIFFVSAIKALSEKDVERFTEFIDHAANGIDKVVTENFADAKSSIDPSGALLKGVSSFYRAFKNMLLLFNKVDEKNFDYTRELSSLSIYTEQATFHFSRVDISNNVRILSLANVVKSFTVFEPFLKELAIVMSEYQRYDKLPEEKTLVLLKLLSQQAKDSLKLIDDTSLNPFVEMCESMTDYAYDIGQQEQHRPIIDGLEQMADTYQGYIKRIASEPANIIFEDVSMLKQKSLEQIRKGKAEEVFKMIESNENLIKDIKIIEESSILSYRFQTNRANRFLRNIPEDTATVEEVNIISALMYIIQRL